VTIEHLLAVVPVTDIDTSREWYERLLGRAPDNRPMDRLVEWRVTDTGWLQVTRDPDRAGTALLNFAVDDLATHLAGLRSRDLVPGTVEDVNKGVQLSAITDPDGNTLTFIGSFRINY
jgi:glyoxylase I family protein